MRKKISHQGNEGFTIYEVLIALAIISIITASLFQGTFNFAFLGNKSKAASIKVSDGIFSINLFQAILKKSYLGKGDDGQVFSGDSKRINGVTLAFSDLPADDFAREYEIYLEERGGVSGIVLKTNDIKTELFAIAGLDASFKYMSQNSDWYTAWPPEELKLGNKSVVTISDIYMSQSLELPWAILLQSNEKVHFVISLVGHTQVPAFDSQSEFISYE